MQTTSGHNKTAVSLIPKNAGLYRFVLALQSTGSNDSCRRQDIDQDLEDCVHVPAAQYVESQDYGCVPTLAAHIATNHHVSHQLGKDILCSDWPTPLRQSRSAAATHSAEKMVRHRDVSEHLCMTSLPNPLLASIVSQSDSAVQRIVSASSTAIPGAMDSHTFTDMGAVRFLQPQQPRRYNQSLLSNTLQARHSWAQPTVLPHELDASHPGLNVYHERTLRQMLDSHVMTSPQSWSAALAILSQDSTLASRPASPSAAFDTPILRAVSPVAEASLDSIDTDQAPHWTPLDIAPSPRLGYSNDVASALGIYSSR